MREMLPQALPAHDHLIPLEVLGTEINEDLLPQAVSCASVLQHGLAGNHAIGDQGSQQLMLDFIEEGNINSPKILLKFYSMFTKALPIISKYYCNLTELFDLDINQQNSTNKQRPLLCFLSLCSTFTLICSLVWCPHL
jgi:hypothetical protein